MRKFAPRALAPTSRPWHPAAGAEARATRLFALSSLLVQAGWADASAGAPQAHALELALAAGSEPVSGAATLLDLVVVAGHAVFVGTSFADAGDQDSWCAAPGLGFGASHARAAVSVRA